MVVRVRSPSPVPAALGKRQMDSPFFAITNFVAGVTTHLNKAHYLVVALDSNATIEDRTGSYHQCRIVRTGEMEMPKCRSAYCGLYRGCSVMVTHHIWDVV